MWTWEKGGVEWQRPGLVSHTCAHEQFVHGAFPKVSVATLTLSLYCLA